MADVMLTIGVTTIRDRLKGFEGDLEARVRFAFQWARTDDTWYTGNDDEKFRAAVGAVILSLDEGSEDRDRVERSVRALRTLSAAMSGIPVDFSALNADDMLPLMGWWHESATA